MATHQQPALVQIDDLHIPDFTYEAEEELPTGDPAKMLLESPPPTIPFDEDAPPRQLPDEHMPSGEELGEAAGSLSPVIEISDGERDHPTRPRRRHRGHRDYTYQNYQNTMEHAILAPPIGKRKREDSDGADFRSKIKRFVKEIAEPYEALEKENKRVKQERDQWKKDKKQLQDQIRYLQRQIHE